MKKFLTWVSLGVFLFVGIYACVTMAAMPRTYDGTKANVSVYELQQDPTSYDESTADGAAAAIIQQNLDKTHALNDVTSIVFDFRGYDTMGEAFILITAVAGCTVILFNKEKRKVEKEDVEDEKWQ